MGRRHETWEEKNIFQIAKAAVQGKIRKLIVADGIQIFGKLDKHTGGVSINPAHLDHEDDDLLDDLSQNRFSLAEEKSSLSQRIKFRKADQSWPYCVKSRKDPYPKLTRNVWGTKELRLGNISGR